MKIRITENQVVPNRAKDGQHLHHPLRSWDIDFDAISFKEVWVEIKGDVRELIRVAKSGYIPR
jgi:hypothetical protein